MPKPSPDDLRHAIAKHEAELVAARSPRQRLFHSFRLAMFRSMLSEIEDA